MANAKARTNKIVEFKEIKDGVVIGMREAREYWGDNISRITNRETQLADSALTALRKETKARGKLSPETFNRYVTKIRTAIKDAGFVNPTYIKMLGKASEMNARYAKRINTASEASNKESRALIVALIEDLGASEKRAKKTVTKKGLNNLSKFLSNKCLPIIDPVILSKLIRTADEHKAREVKADKRINTYQDESEDTQYNYKEIVSLIPELLSVSAASIQGWEKLALGIALATGRRSFEVFYKSTFTISKGRNITIEGFAKKRDGHGGKITIPCLANPAMVVEAVKKLRSCKRISNIADRVSSDATPDEQNETFNNSVHKQVAELASKVLCQHLKKADGKAVKSAKMKDARDLYINCAFNEYKTAGGTSKIDKFTRDNLHHEDIGTANSYKKFVSDKDVTKAAIKKAKSVKVEKNCRLTGLQELMDSEQIQGRKPFIKAMTFIVAQVDKDPDYIASTATLRKAVPNDKGGFKPIIKPALIGELVVILKKAELDFPA